jgi:hypothetical protein
MWILKIIYYLMIFIYHSLDLFYFDYFVII